MTYWIKWLIWDIVLVKIIGVSGIVLMLAIYYTGLATGQAELSYTYHKYGSILSLMVLVIARIEGHLAQKHKDERKIIELEAEITALNTLHK